MVFVAGYRDDDPNPGQRHPDRHRLPSTSGDGYTLVHPDPGQLRRRAHRQQQHLQLDKLKPGERQRLSPGDLTNDTFNLPIYLPFQDMPLLANNQSFQAVDINAGTIASGQTLSLNLIGTASTANLVYIFTGGFTVGTGATLSVAAGPVLISASQTITDDGAMTIAPAASVGFEAGYRRRRPKSWSTAR